MQQHRNLTPSLAKKGYWTKLHIANGNIGTHPLQQHELLVRIGLQLKSRNQELCEVEKEKCKDMNRNQGSETCSESNNRIIK